MSGKYPERCDCWEARAHRRNTTEATFWKNEHIRLTAQIARLEAEIKRTEFRDRTDVAWLQGKVVAQARELKRLNDAVNVRRVAAGEDPVPDATPDHLTAHAVSEAQYADSQVGEVAGDA